jgi:glutamate formiminotransferase / 5-formyltetrahydrofolate cyclo-ligase
MTQKIVQCVPNISEGRDIKLIEYIIAPLKNRSGFKLVSYEPDKDYHRTVITLLGDPFQMIVPLIEFYQRALEKIDLNKHQGEHPRMGAVDVTPFIPIANIKIEECVEYAKQLAIHVADMYQIPVYLYANAAQQPNRIKLPDIRKGEFEGMKDKIKETEWTPDYGPNEIHPTFGVTAIGARIPLIAFNIDLKTTDEKIANNIAKAIRGSSGGFSYVQAGPATLLERGHTQVTMNILDFKKNPMYRVFETVKMEALRYQVDVTGCELVGLVPKDTLLESIKYYLDKDKIDFNKLMSYEDIILHLSKYMGLRDFVVDKIIEANI